MRLFRQLVLLILVLACFSPTTHAAYSFSCRIVLANEGNLANYLQQAKYEAAYYGVAKDNKLEFFQMQTQRMLSAAGLSEMPHVARLMMYKPEVLGLVEKLIDRIQNPVPAGDSNKYDVPRIQKRFQAKLSVLEAFSANDLNFSLGPTNQADFLVDTIAWAGNWIMLKSVVDPNSVSLGELEKMGVKNGLLAIASTELRFIDTNSGDFLLITGPTSIHSPDYGPRNQDSPSPALSQVRTTRNAAHSHSQIAAELAAVTKRDKARRSSRNSAAGVPEPRDDRSVTPRQLPYQGPGTPAGRQEWWEQELANRNYRKNSGN